MAAASEVVLLVGWGKNQAVLVGLIVSMSEASLVVCAAVAAGTDDVSVRTPQLTSVPENVCVVDTSVGPVVLFIVKPEPNDEYSVHVAAVVEAS